MQVTWKAVKQNWIELSVIFAALIVAAIFAILQPIDSGVMGYFGDMATVMLILAAVVLLLVGARRRVV